jgi:hypothetical protein
LSLSLNKLLKSKFLSFDSILLIIIEEILESESVSFFFLTLTSVNGTIIKGLFLVSFADDYL